MIRLTLPNGEHWYVNPDHIVSVKSGREGSRVSTNHQTRIDSTIDVVAVQEPPEEVARKVLEWKLAMERYKAAYNMDIITPNETPKSYTVEGYLRRLAGLEV